MDYEPALAPHICCCCGTREGNTVTLWRCASNARRWPFVCNIGPDWGCNICTWGLVLAPTVGLTVLAHDTVDIGFLIGLIAVATFTVGVLAWTDFGDPYLPKQTPGELSAQRENLLEIGTDLSFTTTCTYCQVIRPVGAKHCHTCDRCVYDLDHHCPWHGKCIGGVNMLGFNLFLWSICGLIVMAAVTAFVWFTANTLR